MRFYSRNYFAIQESSNLLKQQQQQQHEQKNCFRKQIQLYEEQIIEWMKQRIDDWWRKFSFRLDERLYSSFSHSETVYFFLIPKHSEVLSFHYFCLSLSFFLGANSAFVLIVQTSIMCVSWLHRAPFQKEKIKRRRRNSKMKRRAHKSGQRSHIIEDTTENESDTQSKRKCSMNQHKPKNMESKKSTK